MNESGLINLISQELLDKYTTSEENFNLFLAKNFIEKKRYSDAYNQLKISISSAEYPYISYLYMLINAILSKDGKSYLLYKEKLLKLKMPNDINIVFLDIKNFKLSNNSEGGSKNRLSDLGIEKKMLSLIKADFILKSWMIVDKNDKLLSKYDLSLEMTKYLVNLHKFIRVKNGKNNRLTKKIGVIHQIFVEFASKKVLFYRNDGNFYYFIGNENFNVKYFELKLKNEL